MESRTGASVRVRVLVGGVALLLVALATGGIAQARRDGGSRNSLISTANATTTVSGPAPALISGSLPAREDPSSLATTSTTSLPATSPKPATKAPPTVSAARPATTARPTNTTTVRPTTTMVTAAPTTTVPPTTIPANEALVTLEGQFYSNVLITFAGRTYILSPGQDAGPFLIPAGPGMQNTIKVTRADDTNCGTTQTAHFFDPGQHYWVWGEFEVGGGPSCPYGVGVAGGGNVPGPILVVNQTPPGPPLNATG